MDVAARLYTRSIMCYLELCELECGGCELGRYHRAQLGRLGSQGDLGKEVESRRDFRCDSAKLVWNSCDDRGEPLAARGAHLARRARNFICTMIGGLPW